MTNIFKLHSYLIYWKCIRQAKSELSIIHSVSEKVGFTINGSSKCYILIVIFFIFSNFKLILPKILWKSTLLYKGFWELLWSCIRHNYFWSTNFWACKDGPFWNFWNLQWNEFWKILLENDTFFISVWKKLCYNKHKYEIEKNKNKKKRNKKMKKKKKKNIAYSTACNLNTVFLSGLNLD